MANNNDCCDTTDKAAAIGADEDSGKWSKLAADLWSSGNDYYNTVQANRSALNYGLSSLEITRSQNDSKDHSSPDLDDVMRGVMTQEQFDLYRGRKGYMVCDIDFHDGSQLVEDPYNRNKYIRIKPNRSIRDLMDITLDTADSIGERRTNK